MRGFNKQKPPNAFAWFARYVADQRLEKGRPFRSIKAALHEAAIQWEKLNLEEKADWKEKARTERVRFRTDPELRTMTPKEFIAQACEIPVNGMTGDRQFWSRHWSRDEREQYAEELRLLETFDTTKRQIDREKIQTGWEWTFFKNREDLTCQTFMLISVQSSSPVEADNYVPETLAIAQFSLVDGILPYTEFCCSLASDEELMGTRRNNSAHSEHNVGDEDGCQARVGMKAVAKLIFQRAKDCSQIPGPVFFCLADEFEVVYDALCALKSRISKERVSVSSVATTEDLAHCLLKWHNISLPDKIGQLQDQLYFDTLIERSDSCVVAGLRCGAHEVEPLNRCPLSVVRMSAMKLKQWVDNRGIPEQDLPLIDRQLHRLEWPVFSDHGGNTGKEMDKKDGDNDDDDDDSSAEDGRQLAVASESQIALGKHERTLAWVEAQEKMLSVVKPTEPGEGQGDTSYDTAEIAPVVVEQSNIISAVGDNKANIKSTGIVQKLPVIGASRPVEPKPTHVNIEKPASGFENRQSNFGSRPVESRALNASVMAHGQEGMKATTVPGVVQRGRNDKLPPGGIGVYFNHDTSGLGGEMKVQYLLPFGARGIGRGLHLVPDFVNNFESLKSMLKD